MPSLLQRRKFKGESECQQKAGRWVGVCSSFLLPGSTEGNGDTFEEKMPLLTLFSLFWLSGYSIATEITGPTTVNGLERGSLNVRCAYGSQWETYLKWWCRGAIWSSCEILVKTTGSEQEVKGDRLSIRDDQKNHTFTVTMKDLRRDDADTYWCGIERTGTDLGVKVQVTIDPAAGMSSEQSPLQGLETRGLETARGTRTEGCGILRSGGHRGNWERVTQGRGRDSRPTSEKEPMSTDDLVTPQPVYPVPGTAVPGE
ncbi:hypothetical protein P7K49_011750 [Saguinus oedipus]|uniref:Immunoglobulin V-set domain-containing protein n=1 Tax=Saguinus oedipus TaxID=9490 RepID=A0ABQ9VRJ7_SAGOE|nr:hypothetical protein P7K49_011750 [Saguinus oedipus]